MNLVIQGEEIETPDLKELHRIAHGEAIERISDDAFRVTKADPAARKEVAVLCERAKLDFGWVAENRALADFGLLAMDMDSTLISIECIDEIADFAGRKAEVAAVTAAAMRGEIDWPESLRRRVKALAGLDAEALGRVYTDRLRFNKGAERLLSGSPNGEPALDQTRWNAWNRATFGSGVTCIAERSSRSASRVVAAKRSPLDWLPVSARP